MTHPTIENIRSTRREIASEHDFDPQQLGAYYRQLDEKKSDSSLDTTALPGEFLEELSRVARRLEEHEEEAMRAGMEDLANKLSGDRARLARLLQQRGIGTAQGED